MKTFSLSFSLLFIVLSSVAAIAQPWFPQNAVGLPNSANPQVVFSPIDDDVCWGMNHTNSQFLLTTNGGDNWTVSTVTGAAGLECSGITSIDADTAWIAMNDPSGITSGGIFKTTDGGLTWDQQETAFQGSGGYPNVIRFFDADNGVCVGDPRGGYWEIYTTTNGGSNWIRVDSANIPAPLSGEWGIEHRTGSAIGNIFWFQTLSNSLYKTTDRGYSWSVTYNVCGSTGFGFAFKDSLNGLAVDYFPVNAMSRTSDGGETWTPLPLDPVFASLSTFYIAYAKGTNGSYVITSHSPAIPGSAYTTDDGNTWTYINNTPLGPAAFSDWNTGWAGGINDAIWWWDSDILTIPVELVSFSANALGNEIELSWQTATEINNQGFEIYRNGNKIVLVEGKGTTTEKQDYSFVDKNLQSGIYNYRLNQLDFDGTQEVVGELTVYLTLPEEFSLEQNYPNPFNPSTTIRYSISEVSFATIKVYDMLGKEVATLVNEAKPAGSYEIDFNAAELSSGIYFYKLQAGSYIETKKMLLLK